MIAYGLTYECNVNKYCFIKYIYATCMQNVTANILFGFYIIGKKCKMVYPS